MSDNPPPEAAWRGCKGPEPDKPLAIAVGSEYVGDGKNRRQVPILEEFARCPRALIPVWAWYAVDSARSYLAGVTHKDFEPSAQFLDVVRIVKECQQPKLS